MISTNFLSDPSFPEIIYGYYSIPKYTNDKYINSVKKGSSIEELNMVINIGTATIFNNYFINSF